MKLDFICVGTQKGGTTTLHDILDKHSQVFLPVKKEAHFFDRDERYNKGISWWKKEFFSDYSDEDVVGVFTPEYLFYEEVPSRIYEELGPELKIIIIMRNPVDRAFSHYLMSKRRGFENCSFDKAIRLENERILNGGEFERNNFSYISRGFYFKQLNRYFELFKNENILILNFDEEIRVNLNKTMIKIQNFLGVDCQDLNINIKSNKAANAKYQTFNKILNNKTFIKTIIKKLIFKKEIRIKLRKFIIANNRSENTEELDDFKKMKLIRDYFIEDIRKIELKYGLNLESWFNYEKKN